MKDRAYKISRSFFCICSCCVILLLCICPALAADVGLSGAYTFNDQLYQPVGWTEQNVYFLSGDTYYLKITYEPMNEAYGVPVLYFGSTRVYLFAGENTPGQWLPSASKVVDFGSLEQPVSDLFLPGFLVMLPSVSRILITMLPAISKQRLILPYQTLAVLLTHMTSCRSWRSMLIPWYRISLPDRPISICLQSSLVFGKILCCLSTPLYLAVLW